MGRKRIDSTALLTLSEVARTLQASLLTVRGWIREGKLSSVKVGRFRRVGREDLKRFIERGRSETKRYPAFRSDDPLFRLVGIGDSGFKDVSLEHDCHLAGASTESEEAIRALERLRKRGKWGKNLGR